MTEPTPAAPSRGLILADDETPNTAELCEAALCAWEYWLQAQELGAELSEGSAGWHLDQVRYNNGAVACRLDCVEIAPFIHAGYAAACKALGEGTGSIGRSFDWDFVPEFMEKCLSFTPHSITVDADFREKCIAFVREWDKLDTAAAEDGE